MNKKTVYVSAIVSLLSLFTACNLAGPELKEASGQGEKARLRIQIGHGTQSRTLSPTVALSNVVAWKLSGTQSGGTQVSMSTTFNGTSTTLDIETGVWDFILEGYTDATNHDATHLILRGELEETIAPDTTILSFTVEPVTTVGAEPGRLSITINLPDIDLPDGSAITKAKVFRDESELPDELPVDNGQICFEDIAHPAGLFLFSFELYNGDGECYGVLSEFVYVGANLTSENTYEVKQEDLNLTYTIKYDLGVAVEPPYPCGVELEPIFPGDKPTHYQLTDTDTQLPVPTHLNYVFQDWYESADFSGAAVTEIPQGSKGHKQFYAKWEDATLVDSLAWLQTNVETDGIYPITVSAAAESIDPTPLSSSTLKDASNVSIILIGDTANRTVSLTSPGSLFTIGSGVTLTLGNNVTLQGLNSNTASLVMVDAGTLVMESGSKITGNTISTYGSGVFVDSGGTFEMSGGEISGNEATNGGGVFVDSGTFEMSGGEISGNEATNGGGVFVDSAGTFTMSNATISGNIASTDGGGVFVKDGGTFEMSSGIIGDSDSANANSATNGGGVYMEGSGSSFTMNNATISGNSATNGGGGVYMDGGTFAMSNATISGNGADGGGGVFVGGGLFTMNGVAKIRANTASTGGGGVFVKDGGTFTMSGGVIGDSDSANANSATNGGGVFVDGSGSSFTMSNDATISNNSATTNGGGVFVEVGTFTMNSGTISGNSANGGGGVFVGGGLFTMNGVAEIRANSATTGGGGVYLTGGTFTMNNGTISGNSANGGNGGGVYVKSSAAFSKTGGTINGDTDTTHTAGNSENTASSGIGHAVYVEGTPEKKRNSTAGTAVSLNSATPTPPAADPGWELTVQSVVIALEGNPTDPGIANLTLSRSQGWQINLPDGYTASKWYWDGGEVTGTTTSYSWSANTKEAGIHDLFVLVTDSNGTQLSGSCKVTINE